MSQPSGFVPINFRAAGVLLLTAGVTALLASALSWLTGWFRVSEALVVFGGGAALIGLYILYVSRRPE